MIMTCVYPLTPQCGCVHWVGLAHLAQDYLSKWAEQLGDMNVIVIKMRECLMDACIGQSHITYFIHIFYPSP